MSIRIRGPQIIAALGGAAAWPRAARAALRLTGWLSALLVALGLCARGLRLYRLRQRARERLAAVGRCSPAVVVSLSASARSLSAMDAYPRDWRRITCGGWP
jgi:hypothetical protein